MAGNFILGLGVMEVGTHDSGVFVFLVFGPIVL